MKGETNALPIVRIDTRLEQFRSWNHLVAKVEERATLVRHHDRTIHEINMPRSKSTGKRGQAETFFAGAELFFRIGSRARVVSVVDLGLDQARQVTEQLDVR